MKIQNTIEAKGWIEIRDTAGNLLKRSENLDVDSGLNLVASFLDTSSGVTGLTHLAFGTGSTAVYASDTVLDTEVKRCQFTNVSVVNNQFVAMTFFLAADSTYHIQEVALFGNGATDTADSGTMFNRALVDYDNSVTPKDLVISGIISFVAS